MLEVLLVGVAILIAIYGGKILDRLPAPIGGPHFQFEACDDHISINVDVLIEDDFKVGFVDSWDVGRSFSLHGFRQWGDGEQKEGPFTSERVGMTIFPIPDWFKESRIGWIYIRPEGRCEITVGLPYQLAKQALEEFRRKPNQTATIGFKHVEKPNGRPAFPIYSFEIQTPFD